MEKNLKEFQSVLEKEIKKAANVFIIGHMGPDLDSIGSAVGLYTFVNFLGKKVSIIIDEDVTMLEPGVKKILDDNEGKFRIIKKGDYLNKATKKDLLILTDVNKDNMISVGDSIDKVGSIAIIDHHNLNDHTIKTSKSYIDSEMSSASEIVAKILFQAKVKFSSDIANFLLAGIRLDTDKFRKTGDRTYGVAQRLKEKGANNDYVSNLLLEDLESYISISALISNGTVIKRYSEELSPVQVSFTLNRNSPAEKYQKEILAKAADTLSGFVGIDAAFTLGYIDDNIVHISARGGPRVNVGNIMNQIGGGGSPKSAGGRFETENILGLEEKLLDTVFDVLQNAEEVEEVVEKPKVVKVKQIKRKY